MIIECPACSTRYDIKVELPPDGRTVRCAKCEHVWRATAIEEELYSAAEVGEAGDGLARTRLTASAAGTSLARLPPAGVTMRKSRPSPMATGGPPKSRRTRSPLAMSPVF